MSSSHASRHLQTPRPRAVQGVQAVHRPNARSFSPNLKHASFSIDYTTPASDPSDRTGCPKCSCQACEDAIESPTFDTRCVMCLDLESAGPFAVLLTAESSLNPNAVGAQLRAKDTHGQGVQSPSLASANTQECHVACAETMYTCMQVLQGCIVWLACKLPSASGHSSGILRSRKVTTPQIHSSAHFVWECNSLLTSWFKACCGTCKCEQTEQTLALLRQCHPLQWSRP